MLTNPNSSPISPGKFLPSSALQPWMNSERKAKAKDFPSFDIVYQLNVAQCETFRASDHENCLSINSSAASCHYILEDFIFKTMQIDDQINTRGGGGVRLVSARNTYIYICYRYKNSAILLLLVRKMSFVNSAVTNLLLLECTKKRKNILPCRLFMQHDTMECNATQYWTQYKTIQHNARHDNNATFKEH